MIKIFIKMLRYEKVCKSHTLLNKLLPGIGF